jgi:serine/threonine-protein kinase
LALGAGGLVLAFPDEVAQYMPGLTAPTATPRTLVLQPYSVQDLEIIVPPGVDVRDAFRQAYLQKAQQEYGPGTQINNNAPPTFVGGEPTKTGDDPRGTKYRASMQGFILVPQAP